jgi:hypothetical protein
MASFFPRLASILAGDATVDVVLFSKSYLIVGGTVAVVVAIVIMIVESGAHRSLRDVFMTALGIPTLLMGALSAGATTQNLGALAAAYKQDLGNAAGVSINPDIRLKSPSSVPVVSSFTPIDLILSTAAAQPPAALSDPKGMKVNDFGIRAREEKYITVFARDKDPSTLDPLRKKLETQGIGTATVEAEDGMYAVVRNGPARPYSEALRDAVKGKSTGAQPFLVPERNGP